MNGIKFKVGDVVIANGNRGTVIMVDYEDVHDRYPVQVLFDDMFYEFFTEDGKADINHREPSLVLVTREKKIRKKKLFISVHEAPDQTRFGAHQTTYAYTSRLQAEAMHTMKSQVVEVEIEIEE